MNFIKTILELAIFICCIILTTEFINMVNKDRLDKIYTIDKIAGVTIKNQYAMVKDNDNNLFYIPKGFKLSSNIGEQNVTDGVVIIDSTGDIQTKNSEFVWIPVPSYDSIEELKQNFKTYPSYKNYYIDVEFYKYKSSNETSEFNELLESIYKYNGFYIERYEARNK